MNERTDELDYDHPDRVLDRTHDKILAVQAGLDKSGKLESGQRRGMALTLRDACNRLDMLRSKLRREYGLGVRD